MSDDIPADYQFAADIMRMLNERGANRSQGLSALALALGQGIAIMVPRAEQRAEFDASVSKVLEQMRFRQRQQDLRDRGLGSLSSAETVRPR